MNHALTALQRLAIARALADQLRDALRDTIRPDAQQAIADAHTLTGADRFQVTVAGEHVATVTLVKPETRVAAWVDDEEALLDWAEENHPGEVRRTITEGFREELLRRAQAGEVLPGIMMDEVTTAPSHQVRFTPSGKTHIASQLSAGMFATMTTLPTSSDQP